MPDIWASKSLVPNPHRMTEDPEHTISDRPGVNVDNAVGVDIEGDLHLGYAAGGGRDSH